MKLRTLVFGLLLFMFTAVAPASYAVAIADQEIGVSVDVTYASKYVWRGYNIVDDGVIQPSINFDFGDSGTFLNFWYSQSIDSDYEDANELDITVGHSMTFSDLVTFDIGMIAYLFPELESPGPSTTTEVYAGLAFDVLLSPFATLYYDVDDGDGAYLSLGVSYSYSPMEDLSLDPSISLGYNFGQFDQDSGVNDIIFALGATYSFEPAYISVTGSYVMNQEDEVNEDDETIVYVSIGASI